MVVIVFVLVTAVVDAGVFVDVVSAMASVRAF